MPAGLVVHVAHADEGAQQVFGADIGRVSRRPRQRDRAACRSPWSGDRTKRRRAPTSSARPSASAAIMPFLVATSSTLDRSQRRRASTGSAVALQLLGKFAELLDLASVHGFEQRLARREMAVERADADAGAFCHGLQARLRTAGAEHGLRSLQHALAIAHRIRAGLANMSVGTFCHPSIRSRSG